MKRTKIVTHYGKAHRDEFLACCVIIYDEYRRGRSCFIERRIVVPADLYDTSTWVVDTGGFYEPDRLNFDHHQEDMDMCSLDMVLLKILGQGPYHNYRAVSPWLKQTAVHDNNGAKVAADRLRIDLPAYMSTRSPVERFVLEKFAEVMVLHADTYLVCMMRDIGRMIVASAENVNENLPEQIEATPSPVDLFGVRVWDVRSLSSDDPTALAVINQAASQRNVDVLISSTSRQGGKFGIYRQTWAKNKIDFLKVKDHTGVKFVHKNGYYAVTTSECDEPTLLEIITTAINNVTESKPA